jgi:glutathione synthase/RimK-type ligase-like ATP-grasp enzyme
VPQEITIITHAAIPEGAPDDRMLENALVAQGARVRFAVWDDPDVDWAVTPLAIMRSAWDYHLSPVSWFAWIEHASRSTMMVNPPELLKWNTDKRYLGALAAAGVPVVPTAFLLPRDTCDLTSILDERGWLDFIVKPAIGASASGVKRFAGPNARHLGAKHAKMLSQSEATLVQPYLEAVERERERSLVYINGDFSHAFCKQAFNTNATGGTKVTVHTPSKEELRIAGDALSVLKVVPIYARVDLILSEYGVVVMEMELIEPDLGLRIDTAAADRLALACLELAFP